MCAGRARAGDFTGWVALGGRADGDGPAEARFTARAQYETTRVDGIEAVIDAGADAGTRHLELKDAYADKRFENAWHLRFGRGKKILGWEYEDSAAERLTLERSAVYRFMESAGLVGRDYFVSLRGEGWRVAAHYDDAGDAAILPSVRLSIGELLSWRAWGLVQRDQYRSASAWSWSLVTGVELASPRVRAVAEIFAGIDPLESELERVFADRGPVHFAAAKLEAGLVFTHVMPYARAVALWPDVRRRAHETLQGLAGLRVVFQEGFYVAAEIELEATSAISRAAGRVWDDPLYRLQLRYFWT